jgi:hypothetical protein
VKRQDGKHGEPMTASCSWEDSFPTELARCATFSTRASRIAAAAASGHGPGATARGSCAGHGRLGKARRGAAAGRAFAPDGGRTAGRAGRRRTRGASPEPSAHVVETVWNSFFASEDREASADPRLDSGDAALTKGKDLPL